MEKILKFLQENHTFYFATVEGDKPKVRPFGFYMEFEGKLYFGIGKHKKSYKQILENPNVEICTASSEGVWIRINGQAVTDDRAQVLEKAFEVMPMLKDMYNETTKAELGLLYIKDGVAEIADMAGHFESINF